jgi:hypothetical protein
MSDTNTDTDSDYESDSDSDSISFPDVREYCNRLRSDDPRVSQGPYTDLDIGYNLSDAERTGVAQALEQNTSVKRSVVQLLQYTKRSTKAVAKYARASKHLQSVKLRNSFQSQVLVRLGVVGIAATGYPALPVLLRALSRNASVTELNLDALDVGLASVAFQKLLTRTQTLQKLQINSFWQFGDDVQQAAIVSAFANNSTLCELELTQQAAIVSHFANNWMCELELTRQTGLAPLLTALQDHQKLQKIRLNCVLNLSGLEVLWRSQDSKVKELVLEGVGTSTVGLKAVLQELGRNTKVDDLTICASVLSRENVQELTSMLRRNTALTSLDLWSTALGSAGLAEIASALYRNRSVKVLELGHNGLNNIESANVLRELMRRNKTIARLYIGGNFFGRNIPAVRIIAEGVRQNTTL